MPESKCTDNFRCYFSAACLLLLSCARTNIPPGVHCQQYILGKYAWTTKKKKILDTNRTIHFKKGQTHETAGFASRVYQKSRRTTNPSDAVVWWATKTLPEDITFVSFFYYVCRGGDRDNVLCIYYLSHRYLFVFRRI